MSGLFYFMFYIASIIPEFDIKEDILELYVLEQLAGYATYNTNSRGEIEASFIQRGFGPSCILNATNVLFRYRRRIESC
jgi:hypothetical protein